MVALGVGSVDGHPRKEAMATLHSLARLTLTRSNTYQGQQAQSYSDVALAQGKVSQRAVADGKGQYLDPSLSRPHSRDQAQPPSKAANIARTESQRTPTVATGTEDTDFGSATSQPNGQYQTQEEPIRRDSLEPQAQSQPSKSSMSEVTEQKPTLLSYRPDQPPQLNDDISRMAPPPQKPHESITPPTQPEPPLQTNTSSSQPASTPTLKQPPAPLSNRLDPHFNAAHSEPAETLKSDTPHAAMVTNGKPKNIQMPERPNTLDRSETVYMTPASEPSELHDRYS